MIAQKFDAEALSAFPNVDGVVAFKHDGGCAMAYDGSRHRMLARVLGGIARHPNIGGYILIGLGCEQGTLGHLVQSQGLHQIQLPGQNGQVNNQAVPILSIQDEVARAGQSSAVSRWSTACCLKSMRHGAQPYRPVNSSWAPIAVDRMVTRV